MSGVRWLRTSIAMGLCLWTASSASAEPKREAKGPEKAGQEAPKQQEPMNTWYAQALAHSPIGMNVTHFWSKDEKLRAETVIGGRRVVTIVNGGVYYAYDLLVRTGVAIQRSDVAVRQDAERTRPFGNELFALKRLGAEKIGVDNLGGRAADVYQVTDGLGRRKVWATQDEIPLTLRVEIFRRQDAKTLRTDFLNWQRGLPILDEFFVPEPDIEFAVFTYQQYVDAQAERVPIGPVPVLYADLLHGY